MERRVRISETSEKFKSFVNMVLGDFESWALKQIDGNNLPTDTQPMKVKYWLCALLDKYWKEVILGKENENNT